MISPSELDTIRKRGYTDDEIWSKLSQSNPQYDTVKKRGYSLDNVASKYKGGVKQNENAESKSDQGTRHQGDAQRTLDGKVNATNAPGSEGGGELRPLDEGQSQRIYEARVSTDSVKGGENNAKQENAQAEAGYGPQVRKEDGQGVRSQEDARNKEEVKNAGGVQPSTTSKIIGAITAPIGYLSESTVGAISGIQKALGMDKQAEESALMASTAVEDWASTFGGTPVRGGAGETSAKIGAGILELPALALTGTAGIAGMLAQGFGGAKKDLYEKYKQEGLTDEEANKKSSTHAAITTAAALPAYYLGGRIAGKAADAFISESAPKLLNAAGRLGMNAVANGVASAAVRGFAAGIEGEDPIKAAKDVSLEGSIQDVLFAAHSTAEHFKAKAAEGKAQEASTEVSDAMLDVLAKKPEYADIANEEIQRRAKLKVSQEAETTDLPITASAVQQGNILPEVAKFEEAPAKPITLEPVKEAPIAEPTAEAPAKAEPVISKEEVSTPKQIVKKPSPQEIRQSNQAVSSLEKLNQNLETKTVFDPPSSPTLQNARLADDKIARKGHSLTISGGSQEGTILDPKRAKQKFDNIGYARQEIKLPEDFNKSVSEKYGSAISNIKATTSASWLGAHFNGGVAVNENLPIENRGRVVAHELGHASHSLLGDTINKNENVLSEISKIEEYLYPNLRNTIKSAKNPDAKFFNYLLSPDELIAEFNVERISNPQKAKEIAPELSSLLESVEKNKELVKDRKVFPTSFLTYKEAKSRLKVDSLEHRKVDEETSKSTPVTWFKELKKNLQQGYKSYASASVGLLKERGVSLDRIRKVVEDYANDESYYFIKETHPDLFEQKPTKPSEEQVKETSGLPTLQGKSSVGETEVKAEGGVAQGKREGEEEVAKEPTRVVAATFTPDSSNPEVYYTGASHEEAMEKAGVPVETDPAKREDERFGFLHSDGTINPREVSEQVGKESGQFEKQSDRPVAHSTDFDLDVVEPPKVSEEEKGFVKDLASQAREKMGRPGAASKEEFDEMRAVVGAEKIFEGATDKNEWKQRMLDEGYTEENGFTDQDLNKIWRNSKDFTNDFHSSMKGEALSPKRTIKKNIENKSYIPNSILELKKELGRSVSKAKALSEYFRGMQKGAKIGAASAREEGKAITKQKLEEKKKQFEEERASFKKGQQTQQIAMRWHDADKNKIKDSVNDLLFKQIPQSGIRMRPNDVARFSKKLQGILTTPFDPRGGKNIGDKFISRSEIMWDRTSRLLDDIHASANDALATDLRTNIKSAYNDAMSSKTVFPEYKKQIRGLVSDIALRGMTPKTEAKLRELNDRLVAEGKNNSRVMERLADLSKTNIKDLSVDELDALNQQIKELTDLGKQEWKSRQEERTSEVERKKQELEAEDVKPINPAEKIIRDTAVGGVQKAKDYLYNSLQRSLNWLSVHEKARMTIPQLFTALDGKENGWLARNVRNPLLNNFRDFAKDSNAIKEQAIEVANKNNLTENNFVKVAIHAYKEQGKTDEDLLKFSYDKNFKKILDQYNASGLTKGEQNLYKFMREALDKEAQNVVNHFADNENIEIKLVDKYFPFLVDKRKAENIVDPRTGVVLDPSKPSDSLKYSVDKAFHSKTIKAGMKYARVPDSDIPLNMNAMDVFLSHMDNWHYVKNVQPTLNEVSRIVQDPLFQQKYGLVGKNLMKDYIDVLARRGRYSKTQIEKGIDAVRNISMVGTLGFRLNQLKHIANYPLGMAEAGGAGWWSRGLIASKSQEGHDFLKKNMPEIFERSGGDVSIEEAARSGNKAIKAAFIGDRLLDYHNAVGVSLGKYFKGLEERGYNWKDFDKIPVDQELLNESYDAAIKSLGSPSILDQPLITSKGTSVGSRTFGKALMAYQMPKMVKWGRLRNAFTQDLKGKKYGAFAKTMGLLAASSALEAAVAYGSKHAYIAAANGILNALGYQTYEREVDEPAIKAIMDEALLDYVSPIPGSDIAKKYAQVKKYPTAREKILSQTGIPPIDVTTGIMNSGLDFAFDPTNEKKALRVAEDAASFLGPFSSIIQLEKEGKKLLDEEGQARRDAAEAEKEDSE